MTEINSLEHTQKKKKQIVDDEEENTWKFDKVEVFLIVILVVLISKYWAIYSHQSVSVKFSWCEISILRLRWKIELLIKKNPSNSFHTTYLFL